MIKKNSKVFLLLALIFLSLFSLMFRNQDKKINRVEMVGVYWGAFDPPTVAHHAVISTAQKELPLKKLIVVVNNHPYKNYTYSLNIRLELLKEMVQLNEIANVELWWQDEQKKIDYAAIREITQDPICAIAGYDAYQTWMGHSTAEERALYDAIAVIPRGDDLPLLYDSNAFLLPIQEEYRYVSSTQVKKLQSKNLD